jgi:hypothetical protein
MPVYRCQPMIWTREISNWTHDSHRRGILFLDQSLAMQIAQQAAECNLLVFWIVDQFCDDLDISRRPVRQAICSSPLAVKCFGRRMVGYGGFMVGCRQPPDPRKPLI